ncbi:hypothetical protein PILCRDRAFT_59629 [Piloderma croceum F 1598]|uniref:Major facilitator superfamily (MFS) profile domain-containing protein n=1 Tax=Piloderma croceum (strain F 1598) TaxID=765440 RepID=A0A0C3CKY4_PILCF|nr:hypothetical protein PILCRDRAFT_59629 [Piloderma croceum F 1598]
MSPTSLDRAAVYLQNHDQLLDEGSVNARALLRKIDWRIIPLSLMCMAVLFVDKLNISYAAVMGMNQDLRLSGNEFSNTATASSVATLIAEVPMGYIIQQVPPGKLLGINVILWGIITASTAAVKNYHGLLVCRILLGISEATIQPCLMVITGMWYTKPEAARRFCLWFCGLGLGQIVAGLISWGFQRVTVESLEGWRIMFIALGGVTIVFGLMVMILMPDNPMSVKWLSDVEKTVAIQRIAVNQTGIQNTHFKWSHLKELVFDVQIWLLVILTGLISICATVISTYSAIVIRNFGYSSLQTALLNIPSGVVSITTALMTAYYVGRQANRWLWISMLCMSAVLGSALMTFLPEANKGGHLVGIYLVNTIIPAAVLVLSWVTANVAGQTKRAFAYASVNFAFYIGSILGPQTFQAKDAPQYLPAKTVVLAAQSAAIVVAVVIRLYYGRQNSLREKRKSTEKIIKDMEWLNLTDKENKTFRYGY